MKTQTVYIKGFICWCWIFFFCLYKILLQNWFFLYLSILISIKLSLQLQKRLKNAGRDLVETQSCLINTVCVCENCMCISCTTILVTARKSGLPDPRKYNNTRQYVSVCPTRLWKMFLQQKVRNVRKRCVVISPHSFPVLKQYNLQSQYRILIKENRRQPNMKLKQEPYSCTRWAKKLMYFFWRHINI